MVNRHERRRKDARVIARRVAFNENRTSGQWESMSNAGSPPDASPPRVNVVQEGATAKREDEPQIDALTFLRAVGAYVVGTSTDDKGELQIHPRWSLQGHNRPGAVSKRRGPMRRLRNGPEQRPQRSLPADSRYTPKDMRRVQGCPATDL